MYKVSKYFSGVGASLIGIVILISVFLFLRLALYRDSSEMVKVLNKEFYKGLKYEVINEIPNSRLIYIKEGRIRFIYPPFNPQLFYEPLGKQEVSVNIPKKYVFSFQETEFYVAYPYLFLELADISKDGFDGKILIYNFETNKSEIIDPKTPTCGGAYISNIAFKSDILYWGQYEEWSTCSGSFMKKIKISI